MPMHRSMRLLGCAVALALAGCQKAAPVAAAAPEPDSHAPAGESPTPTPPAAAGPVLKEATALEPAGKVALSGSAEAVVDPGATFRVELSGASRDARLLLVDARDALVEGAGTQEVGDVTRLTLAPSAPLVPATRYTLRVDGATTREFHDAAGKAHPPLTFALLVAGAPPPPAPKAKRRHHR